MGHSWVFGYILSNKLLVFYLDSLVDVCTLAANVQHFSCFVEWLIQQHFSDPFTVSLHRLYLLNHAKVHDAWTWDWHFFFGARIIALDRCSIYFRIIHKYSWHPFSSPRNWSKRYPTVTTQDACPPPSWRSVRSWFFKDLYLSSLPKKLLNKKSYRMVNCGKFHPHQFCPPFFTGFSRSAIHSFQ